VTVALDAACVPPPLEVPPTPAADVVVTGPEESSEVPAPTPLSSKRGSHPSKRPPVSKEFTGSIYVGKDTVLRLSRIGVVPTGQPIAASSNHPGGILLSRVGALGIGLVDGDVLTEVEGRPVRTEGEVVAMVLAARSRHAERMAAVVWRAGRAQAEQTTHPHAPPGAHREPPRDQRDQGELWSLVVAMPYL
jgi:hypothetical protein